MPILQNETVNLTLDGTGDVVVTDGQLQLVSGIDGVVQSANTRLKLFMGEWFLDLRAGFPYFQLIYKKNPNIPAAKDNVTKSLATVPGIDFDKNVLSVDFTLDNLQRIGTIDWKAKSQFGTVANTTPVGV